MKFYATGADGFKQSIKAKNPKDALAKAKRLATKTGKRLQVFAEVPPSHVAGKNPGGKSIKQLHAELARLTKKATGRGMTAADVSKARAITEKLKAVGRFPNPGFDDIRVGSRVTISNRFGQNRTGRAVMRGPHGWVLNMGGPHGTPGIADESNTVSVRSASKKRNAAKKKNRHETLLRSLHRRATPESRAKQQAAKKKARKKNRTAKAKKNGRIFFKVQHFKAANRLFRTATPARKVAQKLANESGQSIPIYKWDESTGTYLGEYARVSPKNRNASKNGKKRNASKSKAKTLRAAVKNAHSKINKRNSGAWVVWKTENTKSLAQGYKSGILEREPTWKARVQKRAGKWVVLVKKGK